jgi:hypothetical protein
MENYQELAQNSGRDNKRGKKNKNNKIMPGPDEKYE